MIGTRWLRTRISISVFIIMTATKASVQAQTEHGDQQRPAAQQLAQAESTTHRFNIPAKPLLAALADFTAVTGIQVLSPTADAISGTSRPVSGSLTAAQALDQLLAGSGYIYRFTDANTVMVERSLLQQQGGERFQIDQTTVEARKEEPSTAVIGNLPEPYAGGQVATGGQVGILGNRDIMDTPFNQTNYTAELIQNQQVRHIADLLANDPTAHTNASTSTGADDFNIRGFYVSNTDLLFNGLPGISPSFFNSMMAESIERVEVLKGPGALLNGIAPNGSVGGTINLIPKRAGDEPLTQFTPSYAVDSQFGGHVDLSRRFGKNKEFGVRLNGVYRDGDTAIDQQSRVSGLAALALDYRGERLRLSLDFGYQEQNLKGIRDFTSLAAGIPLPKVPDSDGNYDGRNDFSHPKVFYGTLRGEYDLGERWTAFAAVGGSERKTRYALNNRTIIDAQGNLASQTARVSAVKMTGLAVETGLRGRFETGPIQHQLVLGYNQLERKWRRFDLDDGDLPASNIYRPIFGPRLDKSLLPDADDLNAFQDFSSFSMVLTDTLSILNDRVQLTGGVRYQRLHSNFVTFDSNYKDDKVTPMGGLVVKPWQKVSLYANYIQGLQEGAVAPEGTANAGQGFAPFTTEQYEVGVKVDFGRFATTLALYQIAQPSGIIDTATNVFNVDGEQRHRGIDLNFFGEIIPGVRLLGGAAYIDSELTETQDGIDEGNEGIAVPKWRLVFGGEWDLPFLRRLTLSTRVIYNDSMYLDTANTQRLPDWTRLDVGVRYRFEWLNGRAVTLRANFYNALNESYWDANAFGQLTVSDPFSSSLSATFDF